MRADIFCRVIDNYGDAGISWRLARQLAAEHRVDVTLWIDRPATLARLEPSFDALRAVQALRGVTVRRLDDAYVAAPLPDVVIEAFGCGLPERYLGAMASRSRPPLWINLEYLSAEAWVDTVHALDSPQPRGTLTRTFWFPGFTARTGGLLREAGLFAARDASVAGARVDAAGADALRVTLFCYSNRALPALFDAWAEADIALRCTIPEGVATAALDLWLHGDVPHAGQSVTRGRLTLAVQPYGTQDEFDRLLWHSDVNFVRGEDSFVRAQWAARAFVWQPYSQDENAHALKLDAFMARYAADLPEGARAALSAFWQAFNAEDGDAAAAAWPAFRAAADTLARHGRQWADHLAALPDLASGLVDFSRSRL